MTSKIMFLGTGSDVGKSITATAFCRILKNRNISVAPFKAQNMSNNSYVTIEGGEIGRAQTVQAQACGIAPSIHMNPVLLKPNSETGSQIVVQGKALKNMTAKEYYDTKPMIKEKVVESYKILESRYSALILEGAGSCCEVNLREHDIVNFEMAIMADAPVVLVADIDRGGVFAQIIGTMELLSKKEHDLVKGFIINKFRGDASLFKSGIDFIEKRTQKPVFGLIPHYSHIHIDPEDSVALDIRKKIHKSQVKIKIASIRLSSVSNFTDIEALEAEPDVLVEWLDKPEDLTPYDAVIIPGAKSAVGDMLMLNNVGWSKRIRDYADSARGFIVGICGGFQILGNSISDPDKIEGAQAFAQGIGLLNVETTIEDTKIVREVYGKEELFGALVRGYEIHMGRTQTNDKSFAALASNQDGAISKNGKIFGTYLHGLFDSGEFRKSFLEQTAAFKGETLDPEIIRTDYWELKDSNYDLLAEHYEKHTDIEELFKATGILLP